MQLNTVKFLNAQTGNYEPYEITDYDWQRYFIYKQLVDACIGNIDNHIYFDLQQRGRPFPYKPGLYSVAATGWGCFCQIDEYGNISQQYEYGSGDIVHRIYENYADQIQRPSDVEGLMRQQSSTI